METKDRIFVLLVLSGIGYAGYHYRDQIAERLGLRELEPGLVKAVELTRNDQSLHPGQRNWRHLQQRVKDGEIEMAADAWQVESLGGNQFAVRVTWQEYGETVVHRFDVDNNTAVVRHRGRIREPAAPRD
ncbi:MAG TPA: hypothetical protein ENI87_10945 [bacterium]|nr:hypothetical protein [bacterium]